MTKVSEVFIKIVPELPEVTELPANADVAIYDPNDNILKRIKAALLGGGTEIKDSWVATENYAEGVIKEFQLKLWLSLLPNNLGNTPIEGSSWWVEVSRSTANGFGYWAPGVFTVDPSLVLNNGYLYYLDNSVVVFPFNSVDFTTELASGKWKKSGILTASEIVTLLESLAGDDRLDASAIKNLNIEAAVGGFASNVYFSALDSDLVGYKKQSSAVDIAETILSIPVTLADGNKLVNQYVFDLPANTTTIQQGNWSFTFASYLSSTSGDTRIGFRPFRYTALGEKIFTFDAILWSNEINISTREYATASIIQTSKSILASDRLGCDVYVKTTSTPSITVNIVIGDGNAMFMNVPIAVRHSALRDLNGDSNYVHLTQTEKDSINKVDDSSGFNGNLTPADDTLQKVAQKFDDYVGGGTVTDYENIYFEVAAPDKAYITRGFNWKIASSTEYGGTSTIKTSSGTAYSTGATVTAGDYLTVTNTTINARLVAIIQPA